MQRSHCGEHSQGIDRVGWLPGKVCVGCMGLHQRRRRHHAVATVQPWHSLTIVNSCAGVRLACSGPPLSRAGWTARNLARGDEGRLAPQHARLGTVVAEAAAVGGGRA